MVLETVLWAVRGDAEKPQADLGDILEKGDFLCKNVSRINSRRLS